MTAETTRTISIAVAVGGEDPRLAQSAAALATELELPLVSCGEMAENPTEFLLTVTPQRLELREMRRGSGGPVFVDFLAGPVAYRRRSRLTLREPFASAFGLRHGPITVIDATCGLARDSFQLACLGCTVVAVERSPVLHALVRDGLARAKAAKQADLDAVCDRITLNLGDSRDFLLGAHEHSPPDVVYVDPMHPPTGKAALAKKEMRVCRRIIGDDPDAGELLAVARRVAKRRVVVKRHRHAPPLLPGVSLSFSGTRIRYDVYLPRT